MSSIASHKSLNNTIINIYQNKSHLCLFCTSCCKGKEYVEDLRFMLGEPDLARWR